MRRILRLAQRQDCAAGTLPWPSLHAALSTPFELSGNGGPTIRPALRLKSNFFVVHPTGSEWGEPQATGIPGQTSCPVLIGDGVMAVIYSHRENTDQPGIKLVLSQDCGRTWDIDNPLVVWDAYGKEAVGVARTDSYPASHDVIAYGAPLLTRLSDNEVMASLWCTQAADTHIRNYRLRVVD